MLKMTEPKIDQRGEQPYVAIRSQIAVQDFPATIRESIDQTYAWLGQHGIEGTGAPFVRYHLINSDMTLMDVEIGVPVASAVQGNGRVQSGVLPAGRYASLIYTDVTQGVPANAALLDWGNKQGLKWDQWDTPQGDAFGGRYEIFLSGPQDDPDPTNWDTEVAMRLKD
jgi:effector-binding domain-containing protein